MKKQILTMFTGLFIGAIITGGASAYAAGILQCVLGCGQRMCAN